MHFNTTMAGEGAVATAPNDSIYDSYLKDNILSTVFHEIGMGMSRGSDGYLYLVQLFR